MKITIKIDLQVIRVIFTSEGYFVNSAVKKGMIPFNWDTGPYGNNTMGIFDRNTGTVVDHGLLEAIMMDAGKITSINSETNLNIPDEYRLDQNYPNPFNPETTISYSFAKEGSVSLEVFDLLDRKEASSSSEWFKTGTLFSNPPVPV
ncbi:MAG: hypothetical protein P8Z35_13940 [Ignavibacteriaceae bacterium]